MSKERKEELSRRQMDVYTFICNHMKTNASSPTYREIGDALGISSTNGVADHVKALIKKGYIETTQPAGTSRGLRPTAFGKVKRSERLFEINVYGPNTAPQDEPVVRKVIGTVAASVVMLQGSGRYEACIAANSVDGIMAGSIVVYRILEGADPTVLGDSIVVYPSGALRYIEATRYVADCAGVVCWSMIQHEKPKGRDWIA